MKWCKNVWLVVVLLCAVVTSLRGEAEWKFGSGYIENISSTAYKGDIQVWAIEREDNCYMFFATATGLSVWDGVRWSFYKTSSNAYLRCLYYDKETCLLYSGGDNEFGYWKQNEYGDFEYTQLYLNKDITAGKIFWRCYASDGRVYFQTHEMIFCWDSSDNSISDITPEGYINYMHLCDGILLVQVEQDFYKLDGKKMEPLGYSVPDRVVNVVKEGNEFYFFAEDKGIFVMKNGKINELNPEVNRIFSGVKIFSASAYKDHSFLVGSVVDGFYLLDRDGNIREHVTSENGLQNTTVLSLGVDSEWNIWLGLDGGIAKMYHEPREKYYQCFSGKIGSVYAIVYYDKQLYLGTNKGLFRLNDKQETQLIAGSQGQVWDVYHIGNDLIVSHDKGLFKLENDRLVSLPYPGSWMLRPLAGEQNLYFSANFSGLTVYELLNGHLTLRNHLANYKGANNNAYVDKYGYIWLRGADGSAVRLRTDKGRWKVEDEKSYYFPHNGPALTGFCKLDNEVIFYSGHNAYMYDITTDSLVDNTYYSGLLKMCEDVPVSIIQRGDNFLYVTRNRIGLIERVNGKFVGRGNILSKSDGKMIPFAFRRAVPVWNDIFAIGLQNGVAFYDLSQKIKNTPSERLCLRKVEFSDVNNQTSLLKVNEREPLVFPSKAININFYFTGLSFSRTIEYRMDGEEWIPLVLDDAFTLPYLKPGSHVLEVRNTGMGEESDPAFRQEIKVESPWFLNEKSVLISFLVVIGLLLLGYHFYIRRLERKHLRLSVQQEEEMKKQKAEHEFAMLRIQIKEKDKKLMNYTMDGINRNNMLSEIRDEVLNLKEMPNPDHKIKSIVKKIDSHLNDKENWMVFEKYFNNIYDGFFDRLAVRYPDLTPNELKICAYIKLNLTSKEIAVLMNISPASVEMARYRLRKKLNLSTETSLVNLMSEI